MKRSAPPAPDPSTLSKADRKRLKKAKQKEKAASTSTTTTTTTTTTSTTTTTEESPPASLCTEVPPTESIDDLFSSLKEEKKEKKEVEKAEIAAAKTSKPTFRGDRNDLTAVKSGQWVDDGLGGIFNNDGYTGRKTDDGMKIFKAHLFNVKDFGTSKLCPFDCQCCFI